LSCDAEAIVRPAHEAHSSAQRLAAERPRFSSGPLQPLDALRLDAKARAELAAELLASLDGPADPDAATAWDEEIQRRVDALEAGAETLESWESVKRRIASDILGRWLGHSVTSKQQAKSFPPQSVGTKNNMLDWEANSSMWSFMQHKYSAHEPSH